VENLTTHAISGLSLDDVILQ